MNQKKIKDLPPAWIVVPVLAIPLFILELYEPLSPLLFYGFVLPALVAVSWLWSFWEFNDKISLFLSVATLLIAGIFLGAFFSQAFEDHLSVRATPIVLIYWGIGYYAIGKLILKIK